jgi:hypothetical protein
MLEMEIYNEQRQSSYCTTWFAMAALRKRYTCIVSPRSVNALDPRGGTSVHGLPICLQKQNASF